jgi:integrase
MHRFHQWGALEEHWKLNGIMAVPTPRVEAEPKARLSLASARSLLAAAVRPLDLRVVLFGLYAGCRIAEAAAMDERHVQSDKLVFKGKGRKTRTVPIHPALAERLDEILSFVPNSVGVLHSAFKRVRERAKVLDEAGEVPTPHSLRRTFACVLYDDCEVPYEVVATMMGHKLGVTNRSYAPVSFPKMKDAVFQIDYFQGLPVQGALF